MSDTQVIDGKKYKLIERELQHPSMCGGCCFYDESKGCGAVDESLLRCVNSLVYAEVDKHVGMVLKSDYDLAMMKIGEMQLEIIELKLQLVKGGGDV